MGDFEVATGGGFWVAIRANRLCLINVCLYETKIEANNEYYGKCNYQIYFYLFAASYGH